MSFLISGLLTIHQEKENKVDSIFKDFWYAFQNPNGLKMRKEKTEIFKKQKTFKTWLHAKKFFCNFYDKNLTKNKRNQHFHSVTYK